MRISRLARGRVQLQGEVDIRRLLVDCSIVEALAYVDPEDGFAEGKR